ncbi:MAG TPA: PQQ-binding-like beta-propeller repeat protein, partial [Acidimicrobiia bacterium]
MIERAARGGLRAVRVTVVVAVALGAAIGTAGTPAGAAPRRSAASPTAVDSSATAYQINPTHDGRQDDTTFIAPLTKLWSLNLRGTVQYPLIVDGVVFVDVAHHTGYGTSVSAYGIETGNRIWGPVDIGGTYGFGALTYENGRVFALNFDGVLTALDASTGAVDWSKQMPGQYAFTSPPTAAGGVVYAGGAGSGGTVYAVDEATGAVNWSAGVMNGDHSSPAIDSTGVYVSYACEQAYSFTTAGALRWHHSTGCEGGGGRTDVLHGGRDYIRDDAGMTPAILDEANGNSVGSFASVTAPAFDANTMFTLGSGTVTATDITTGTTEWSNSDGNYVTAPLVVNGYVIEGAGTGDVHVLDELTGAGVWSGSAGGGISAPDEHNANGLTGLAEAEGHLAVPARTHLTMFGSSGGAHVRFTSGPANGAIVGAGTTFGFTSNQTGPSYTCQLDSAAPVACSSPYTLADLSDGPHSFSVIVSGPDGTSPPATANFVADRVAPNVAMTTPTAPFTPTNEIGASWSATDSRSGVADYDVRYRIAPSGSAFGAYVYPAGLQATTATSTTIGGSPGDTVCASIRARDEVGNVSAWSPAACEAVAIDDRGLAASAGWYQ